MSEAKYKNVKIMWSPSRGLSTATMYSFSQRKDTKVLDEPFHGWFFKTHPGLKRRLFDEVIAAMDCDIDSVIENLEKEGDSGKVILAKHIGNQTEGLDLEKLKQFEHFILIRHPAQVAISFDKTVMQNPEPWDLSFPFLDGILSKLIEWGRKPIVINAEDILQNPPEALEKLCNALEIPYDDAMLTWSSGARPEDGLWGSYCYSNIHNSSGFVQRDKVTELKVPPHLEKVVDECLPIYNKINAFAIQ